MTKLQLLARESDGGRVHYMVCDSNQTGALPDQTLVLTPPLPCDEVGRLVAVLPTRLGWRWWHSRIHAEHALKKQLKRFGVLYPGFPLRAHQGEDGDRCGVAYDELRSALVALLEGRILPDTQLAEVLRDDGWWPLDIQRSIDDLVNQDTIQWFPGITIGSFGSHQCQRCHSADVVVRPCVVCGRRQCPYCRGCDSLGEMRGCTRLLAKACSDLATLDAVDGRTVPMELRFALTAAQERAAACVGQFLKSGDMSLLVWAACGAGKTEVVYPAIRRVLAAGEQVLFAVPRKDVVRELGERVQAAFPHTPVSVHYGGQPWESRGPLVVATTHQVLRFYRRFALTVLDEVDAFPYHGNEALRFGLQRATKLGGKRVEMTATPIGGSRGGNTVTIPARHHGYPLPVPRFVSWGLSPKDKLARTSLSDELVGRLATPQTQWLLFVPTVAATTQVASVISRLTSVRVAACSASDTEREHKVVALQQGEIGIMVATSILERGITIPKIQVMVLYCDHPVFDANALIQMAGRVGRSAQAPSGEVWFVGRRQTPHIRRAIGRIMALNEEAASLGLLRR